MTVDGDPFAHPYQQQPLLLHEHERGGASSGIDSIDSDDMGLYSDDDATWNYILGGMPLSSRRQSSPRRGHSASATAGAVADAPLALSPQRMRTPRQSGKDKEQLESELIQARRDRSTLESENRVLKTRLARAAREVGVREKMVMELQQELQKQKQQLFLVLEQQQQQRQLSPSKKRNGQPSKKRVHIVE